MLGGASLVHAGLGATSTGGAFTDLSGLEGLVNNAVGGSSSDSSSLQSHHSGVGHHYPHHHSHHAHHHAHHHHPSVHHHSSFSFHHPNQPLPPHRPFTPPGALNSSNSHLHSSLVSSGDNNTHSSNSHTSHSYSPNSTTTSHMPTSTVKIKSGKYLIEKELIVIVESQNVLVIELYKGIIG